MKANLKTLKIILIRHGESLVNLDSHLIGRQSPETRLAGNFGLEIV